MQEYRHCCLCPRNCGVDRLSGVKGVCGENSLLRIGTASIHRGEEPPVTGLGGSGTVFITGCNLGCGLCQNYQVSQEEMGKVVSREEFADICLRLQEKGAENINIVTGSHAVPAITAGFKYARSKGLKIPALWNSSGYESLSALSLLDEVIDVYLPDLKSLDKKIGEKFFNAVDYPEHAEKAIKFMMKSRRLKFKNVQGIDILLSGVIIRHLILPDHLESTKNVIRWFAENCQGQGRALLSLMTQYTPLRQAEINRYLNEREYEQVLKWLDEFGIDDGFYQELILDSSWLPDFNRTNPFSSELSTPVWHWHKGMIFI